MRLKMMLERFGFAAILQVWAVLSCGIFAAPALALEGGQQSIEAAFLYNFVKFISWPDAKVDDSSRRVNICIVGGNIFGEVLDEIVTSGDLKGVQVLRIKEASAASCHLAFLAFDSKAELRKALKHFSETQVVTVSEEEGFLEAGGNIQFFAESSRVRFSVNTKFLATKGIVISSHMLSLAAKVISD